MLSNSFNVSVIIYSLHFFVIIYLEESFKLEKKKINNGFTNLRIVWEK